MYIVHVSSTQLVEHLSRTWDVAGSNLAQGSSVFFLLKSLAALGV